MDVSEKSVADDVVQGSICAVDGCENPPRSATADWCKKHYHRWYRHGDVEKVAIGSGRQRYVRKYKTVYDRGHPIAPPSGIIYVHRRVLFEKIGPGDHPCHWECGRVVRWMIGRGENMLVSDHLDGQGDNNDPANLVPACLPCNTARGAPKRAAELRADGWWSNNDTIARLKSGGRKDETAWPTVVTAARPTVESGESCSSSPTSSPAGSVASR